MYSKILLLLAVPLTVFGCSSKNEISPDDPDWYILKSPVAEHVQGVYGSIDDTLWIATLFNIYSTSDKGKNWKLSNYNPDPKLGLFGFYSTNDTLMILTARRTFSNDPNYYATDPYYITTDKGKTWNHYTKLNRVIITLNQVISKSGIIYKINEQFTPINSNTSYLTTPGVITSDGREINLPKRHVINSIYLDKNQRLYVSASPALCGELKNSRICGDEHGILFISKHVQP